MAPHLDDAVLSCGATIARCAAARVVTVYTDAPDISRTDGWNFETTGVASARGAQEVRRSEDERALARLGAAAGWLGRVEAEYRYAADDVAALATDIVGALVGGSEDRSQVRPLVVAPLGLRHPDHLAVSDACLGLAGEGRISLWLWRDLPYAASFPNDETARMRELSDRGVMLGEPVEVLGPTDLKTAAVGEYASQVPRLVAEFGSSDLGVSSAERMWPVRMPNSDD